MKKDPYGPVAAAAPWKRRFLWKPLNLVTDQPDWIDTWIWLRWIEYRRYKSTPGYDSYNIRFEHKTRGTVWGWLHPHMQKQVRDWE